jgi:hypothetical protein
MVLALLALLYYMKWRRRHNMGCVFFSGLNLAENTLRSSLFSPAVQRASRLHIVLLQQYLLATAALPRVRL